jgi:hypothetical protein
MHPFDHHARPMMEAQAGAPEPHRVIRDPGDRPGSVVGDPSARTVPHLVPHLRRLLLFAGVLFFAQSGALQAHVDRLIELKGTRLVGLPENFAPAELDVKAGQLRIGHRAMTFSPFLQGLFDQPHELVIAASWYHDLHTFPPYISLRIKPKGKDFSYEILLNLQTLELMDVFVTLRESATYTRQLRIALSEEERRAIRASIHTVK